MYYAFLLGDTATITQYPGEYRLDCLLAGPFSEFEAAQQAIVDHLDNEGFDLGYDYVIRS